MNTYVPVPVDTSDIALSPELLVLSERLAQNTHDIWARGRIKEGWVYGSTRDDGVKTTPCLVPYEALPDSEKEYDRATALETLKLVLKLGYEIVPIDTKANMTGTEGGRRLKHCNFSTIPKKGAQSQAP